MTMTLLSRANQIEAFEMDSFRHPVIARTSKEHPDAFGPRGTTRTVYSWYPQVCDLGTGRLCRLHLLMLARNRKTTT